MMSAPFPGPPQLPFGAAQGASNAMTAPPNVLDDLAALPRPRKHYHWYYSTREADADMRNVMQLLKSGPLAVRDGNAILGHVTADGVLARLLDPRA